MKQLIQYVNTGESVVADVPVPRPSWGKLLIAVANSLVSAGTERMVVDFAEKSLVEKARSRPDLVRQTLDKASREGVLATYEAVQNRLEQPMALGYSCAGTVIDVGEGVQGFSIGDRVACAGSGYAVHAEIVTVPQNLAVKLPESADFESAAFTTLAAIALQGIRLAEVKLGEVVAVIGLGLLGQLTVQMLKAAGCIVIGTDLQDDRTQLAHTLGATAVSTNTAEFATLCSQYSSGQGVDSVLITADTKSNQPIELAGEIARKKGIVVAVGAVGMNIPRKVYYEKELDFRISSSYGPGRYDTDYEENGQDYPYAYVRWTENRNMQAYINMVAANQVDIAPLISHRFPIVDGAKAYELITGKLGEPFLGVLLSYPENPKVERKIMLSSGSASASSDINSVGKVSLGVLGAGLFANSTMLPALKKISEVQLKGIASASGVSGRATADRFKFDYCTTDINEILQDSHVNTVAILTRHNLHARQVIAGLNAGKHVFVEKPLCLNPEELVEITDAYNLAQQAKNSPQVMVGFNRRFAPYIQQLKTHLDGLGEPLVLNYRANAGFIPLNHWTHDLAVGGGRLLGEGVHFIDLLIYLADSQVVEVMTQALPDNGKYSQDNFILTMRFASGSLGTVTYTANGDKSFSKEMLEVFGGGLSARMDDYRTLVIRHDKTRIKQTARLRQEKGHLQEWQELSNYLTGKTSVSPMPFDRIAHVHQVAFAALRSLRESKSISLVAE